MEHTGLVKRIGANVDQLAHELRTAGYTVFLLPLGIADRAAFFEAIKATAPLDPPLVGSSSWEALSDSLWSGLDQLAAGKIAILWPSAQCDSSSDLATALSVLDDVTRSLADPDATDGTPKHVLVVIT